MFGNVNVLVLSTYFPYFMWIMMHALLFLASVCMYNGTFFYAKFYFSCGCQSGHRGYCLLWFDVEVTSREF